MQKPLFYTSNIVNGSKAVQGFDYFRILVMCLLSFCSILGYSQENDTIKRTSPPTIVLKNGAKIFSKDESFNKQILDNKIVIKNSDVLYQENSSKSNLLQVVAKKMSDEKSNLQKQLKAAEDNTQREAIKKVRKEIDQHKEKMKSFPNEKIDGFPSSERLVASSHINQDYIGSFYHGHSFSKIYTAENIYIVFTALDFLHSQKITHYNSKSLAFCYSEVYSVRPPPLSI
ncbi:hypothetical protein CHRY9390_02017 [Chryseobacterium aquaeductus]|uniref:Uncharacterized protein n=1 Tax=Chryseobacterium aquaeductus TaxID=2675056 RepID=A0A9N8QUX5_9FLAO|nr:hypothetical protein [Chryseobacterium aquaeductus]CAA7331318.1 hypothetical protein CHRY9390_02017 [Chryseobacterium potabilaquae]CAD7809486.1 hypothetical protein CHRY9390_02017 [Chryseobacterium aquaeductus]